MSLRTVASHVGASPSVAQVIYRPPALVQELNWRPQHFSPEAEHGCFFMSANTTTTLQASFAARRAT
jgi:hypothetical protein